MFNNTPNFELQPRPRPAVADIYQTLMAMGYVFFTDYTLNPSTINPLGQTHVLADETEYLEMVLWEPHVTTPPTWAEIVNATKFVRVDTNNGTPGQFKLSPWNYDHGDWAICPNGTRRNLVKADFPCLYEAIGDTFTEIGVTPAGSFGLPKASEVFLMAKSNTIAYGAMGGAKEASVSLSGLPSHKHTLPADLAKVDATSVDFVKNVTIAGLLGTPVITLTKENILKPSAIGSGQETGSASVAGSSTNVPTVPPYLCAGNLFIHVGKDMF